MANEDVEKTLAELSRELGESKARLEEAQRVAHVGHWGMGSRDGCHCLVG